MINSIITIDTEGDNQWDHGRELTLENIKFIPRFQELCNKYNIHPTYLVTSEVCQDNFSKQIFSKYVEENNAEIGAHLHAWTSPPFRNKIGLRYNDCNHIFATELSEDLLDQKIENLTAQIQLSFNVKATSFRSGRFGFDENVARILVKNGYLVDSSITPFINWEEKKGLPNGIGGPNFLFEKNFPINYNFFNKQLLEIPITILPTRFPLNKNHKVAQYYFKTVEKNIPLRILRRLFFKYQPLWLRPYPWMTINLLEEIVNESIRLGIPNLVMMFHSSELMPGCSIYRKNKVEIDKLYSLLEGYFNLLHTKEIPSYTLTEAAKKLLK